MTLRYNAALATERRAGHYTLLTGGSYQSLLQFYLEIGGDSLVFLSRMVKGGYPAKMSFLRGGFKFMGFHFISGGKEV